MLYKTDQLDFYFDEIVIAVDEVDVLIRWKDALKCENNISSEFIETYKLGYKYLDMKSEQCRQKMICNMVTFV